MEDLVEPFLNGLSQMEGVKRLEQIGELLLNLGLYIFRFHDSLIRRLGSIITFNRF